MTYRIDLTRAARRDLKALRQQDLERVDKRLLSLRDNPRPRGVEKLSGKREPLYRIRVGSYRVIYRIEDEVLVVLVIRIGHRREIYRSRTSTLSEELSCPNTST